METECARCGQRGNELDNGFAEWEAIGSDGEVVCQACVTDDESSRLDEDMMDLADTTPAEDPSDPRTEGH